MTRCFTGCIAYRHLALISVFQSKIVPLCQVEMDTNQVKEHLPGGTLLEEKGERWQRQIR